jgi:hypothetical protein
MSTDYNGSESSGDCSICNSNNDNEDNNQATANYQATANTQAASAIPTATGNQAPFTNGGNNNSTIKPCSPSLTISTLPSALKLFLDRGSANTPALSLFLGSAPGNTAALPSCLVGIGAGCVAGY